MQIAVVIPAWNEEQWLPRLFESVRRSNVACRVVVADNDSTDDTRAVALGHRAMVVRGGLPAEGRNAGARAAAADTLLFLDADVVVLPATLERAIAALGEPGIVAAHVRLCPLTSDRFVRACYWVMHAYFRTLNRIGYPQGVGSFILVRREAFQAIDGFREHISVGEDADFFRRLGAIGQVAYLDDPVFVSARRFRLENPLLFAAKCVMWAMLRLFGLSASLLPYRWMTYPASFITDEEACRAANGAACGEGRP